MWTRLIWVKKPWSGVWLSDDRLSKPTSEATSKLTRLSQLHVDHYNPWMCSNKSNSRAVSAATCFDAGHVFNLSPKMAQVRKYVLWRHLRSPIAIIFTNFVVQTIHSTHCSTNNCCIGARINILINSDPDKGTSI